MALRELSGAPEGERNWVKDRMVYTHGYGFGPPGTVSPTAASPTTSPRTCRSPPSRRSELERPQIYFGERSATYSVVGGRGQQELNYPDNSESGQQSSYHGGRGGIDIDSFFRKRRTR